ncbi:MAG: hypothetical protein U9R72_02560 [Chloroflexota bacterium]|nr:hypothetical protein [Chloroflexota bacterium]
MSIQEAALYGKLLLYLRDRLAELLAGEDGDVEDERERLDAIIRTWFFTPQRELHGCAPRELIWAERRGEPNPVHPERLDEFFVDDCPLCQADFHRVRAALEADEDPGWEWYYDGDGYPLIARYDPEGWDEFWVEQEAAFEEWRAEEAEQEGCDFGFPVATSYEPFPVEPDEVSPEEFVARLRQPWLDPALHHAARALTDRLDCPQPSVFGFRYRPLTYDETLSLLVGLHEHGVDVEMLVAQIEVFPYQDIALDWLSRPEENAALMIEAMEHEVTADEGQRTYYRHHRDFILMLSQAIPPGARLWLQGWLEAVAHGTFARASKEEVDDTF